MNNLRMTIRDTPLRLEDTVSNERIDFAEIHRVLHRQWRWIALGAAAGFVGSLLYVQLAAPFYDSEAELLIDSRQLRATRELSAMTDPINNPDLGMVDSEVAVLTSDNILRIVIDRLNLTQDISFNSTETKTPLKIVRYLQSLLDLPHLLSSSDASSDTSVNNSLRSARIERSMIDTISRNLTVSRTAKTWVISILYSASSPERATMIANAVLDAYMEDRGNSVAAATRRASQWLERRTEDLRTQYYAAETAAAQFRADNGLLVGLNGNLVSDQELAEITTQLTQARSAVAEADARYSQIQALIASGAANAVVPDALTSPIIADLRKRSSELSQMRAAVASRYGGSYFQVKTLEAQMREYERQILDEFKRIALSYQSNLQVASARVDALKRQSMELENQSSGVRLLQVHLRQLEDKSNSLGVIYNAFLSKFQESIQQTTYPVSEARVISPASIVLGPSSPRKPLFITMGIMAGLFLGAGVAGFRELSDGGMRTGDDVRVDLGVPFLGYLPMIQSGTTRWRPTPLAHDTSGDSALLRHSLDFPFSLFSEGLRRIKGVVGLQSDSSARVIGVTSTVAGEGKSTVCVNFGRQLAADGSRVLIIDADMRSCKLSRLLAVDAKKGFLDVITTPVLVNEAIVQLDGRLHFLPTLMEKGVSRDYGDIIQSKKMALIIGELKSIYDFVLLDLPPSGQFADARMFEPLIDGCIFVIEWGGVPTKLISGAFLGEFSVRDKVLGAVFNKTDVQSLRRYGVRAGIEANQGYGYRYYG